MGGFRKELCRVTHKNRVFTSKPDDKTKEMEARFLAKFATEQFYIPR